VDYPDPKAPGQLLRGRRLPGGQHGCLYGAHFYVPDSMNERADFAVVAPIWRARWQRAVDTLTSVPNSF